MQITYPPQLPVSERRGDIAEAIRDHQVVIVAGETGSGKTTQLPKICLELGRGGHGRLIGHTQPRRIAARSVAERIAEELGTQLGDLVGYQVRFTDRTSRTSRVKLMTDGILLAELQRDRDLRKYDTIIIDEAHERSLNIDFLLGYLKRLLPRRPDLKVIVTSATIDTQRFAAHFALGPDGRVAGTGERVGSTTGLRPAPIIEVSGRTYPVEIRYRPLMELSEEDEDGEPVVRDQTEAIVEAVKELSAEGPGDVLVFLPGEREIRDAADALSAALGTDRPAAAVEIVPLYSRLSAAEQHKVFESHSGRRVVLATNVAETSLTVPGIRYVVDTGVARISRYSSRTKVQRLPIEPISQASANQRSGRCGRTSDGVAIRLYSEEDFAGRPEFTDPEILRTNLASVILQMASLGLGEIGRFPFVEAPDRRNVQAGVQLLEELGALAVGLETGAGRPPRPPETGAGRPRPATSGGRVASASERIETPDTGLDKPPRSSAATRPPVVEEVAQQPSRNPRLTKLGRRLARLPIDPRLGRMILEAERLGCVREVIVIAAALSLQDPRERPGPDRPKEQAQADELHARYKDESSDFLTWLNLWRYIREQQRELSSSAFRRMCRREFLHYLRVREWQEFESQLRQVCKEMKVDLGKGGFETGASAPSSTTGRGAGAPSSTTGIDADGIHQALLSGLLSHIGLLEEREKDNRGTRPARRTQREYLGARNTRFAIFPGSVLARKNPPFVMAGELVETGRLWARQNAAIKPEWAERLAGDMVRRTYSEPHWSSRRAAVMARERVTLYGVPLVADRPVNYGRIDPEVARELFIRHALVYGEWRTHHRFLAENQRLLEEAQELEHKARRRDIVVDEHALFEFYDARIPANVVSGAHFDQWWKRQRDKSLLTFDPEMLTRETDIEAGDFPEHWESSLAGQPLSFSISYHFEPGSAQDGLTIDVPVSTLNRVGDEDFSWNVPGLREELVTALIRSLPKAIRTSFVPAPDKARQFLREVPPGEEPLLDALERWGRATAGVVIPREAWDWSKVPEHLRPTYRIVGDDGRETARGKDLAALKKPLEGEFRAAIAEVAGEAGLSASGQRSWTFADLAATVTERRAGHEVTVHPCLTDEGPAANAVGLMVVGSAEEAEARHRLGVARLLLVDDTHADLAEARRRVGRIAEGLTTAEKLALVATPYPSAAALIEDCRAAVVQQVVDARPRAMTEREYDALRVALGRPADHEAAVRAVLGDVLRALEAWRATDKVLSGRADMYQLPALTDMRDQVARLMAPGFIRDAGPVQLRRYPAYFRAIQVRRERLDASLQADRQLQDRIAELQQAYLHQLAALPAGRPPGERLRQVRWMLEEYRIQLWAQQIGTAQPVSDARIRKLLG